MPPVDRTRRLLSGPRGRRLCSELLAQPLYIPHDRAGTDWRAELRRRVAATDPGSAVHPERVAAALVAAVDSVRYWQEPDDEDFVLRDDGVAEELAPIAEALAASPTTTWWSEQLAVDDQHAVAWPDTDRPHEHRSSPVEHRPAGAAPAVEAWRDETLAAEARAQRERPADPRAPWGGEWWSTPVLAGLLVTARTRPVETVGARTLRVPVGLSLVEDGMGWSTARTWPLSPPETARIYEITDAEAWTALVAQHPLEVSASRRHDWWRVTGREGAWVIPDWAAVATRFDAVHLTVDAYLTTAGRALPVERLSGSAATMLAGFDPDATWWLTDVSSGVGEPTDWRSEDERWEPLR